jgi:serine/threonine protein kinase
MTLERDSRLGKYVIRARIGAGGMGAVYRAYDTVLKREVAIKTILSDKIAERDFLARFRREALAISQLDDPHIVRLIDFVEGDPSLAEPPYMVMELLRGQDFHSIIRQGPVPTERAVDILLETCAAVGTCHRYGFVHRDLKATNIFVTEYNTVETAKVLDFGVAKVWGEAPVAETTDPPEVTRKGIAVGTPEYLAPEILRGGPATPHTDQYALGILLYAALTGGRKPFEASKIGEFRDLHLLQAILKGDHVGPRTHRPEIPEGLEQVIERAMAHDAERRFSSVHALGEALLKWASPRARLQWTGHFTSAPKAVAIQHSTVIPPEQVAHARAAVARGKSAVVTASSSTRPVGSGELREILETEGVEDTVDARAGAKLTSETRRDAPLDPGSLVIVEEGASAIPVWREPSVGSQPAMVLGSKAGTIANAPPPAVSTSNSPSRQPAANSERRFPIILAGGALVAALAIGFVFVRRGTERAPERPPASPAALVPPPVSAPVPTTATPPPAPAPSPTPIADSPGPIRVISPDSSTPAPSAADRKTRVKRHLKPKVDENGIGIPSD